MNIHELNYLLCIAKHQNMTKAARELYISQPTLSKHLGKLEHELGIKLFSRVDNGYIPTYAGRRYLDYASRVLELTREWEKELADLQSFDDGELNVAIPLMRSSCMIPEILPAFRQLHPRIRLNFLEETHSVQERLLSDNQIDFAIFSDGSLNPKLECETLGQEEILLAVSPDHPLAKELQVKTDVPDIDTPYPPVNWTKLYNEKFILHFPEQNTGGVTKRLLQKHGITPQTPFYTRNTQAALLLVQQNEGICFAPETYIKNMTFHTPPVCFSLNDPEAFTTTIIAYRKGAYLTAYARDFIQISKNYFREP